MLYLGKTATQDTYGGLGTVTVGGDAKSGTFQLDDGTASGRWNCGNAVAHQSALPRSASGGTPRLAA